MIVCIQDGYTLDPNGYCCRFVDECGVCEGTGTTCGVDLDFNVQVSTRRVARVCTDSITSVITAVLGDQVHNFY